QMPRMRRIGTPDSSSPLVVRSSSRSWNPNDSGPIGPRCGARKPARASARNRASGTSRIPAASRSEKRLSVRGSTSLISALALIEVPSLGPVSALAALDLLHGRRLGLLPGPRGGFPLERAGLGGSCAGLSAAGTLPEALLESIHQIDHLRALCLRS